MSNKKRPEEELNRHIRSTQPPAAPLAPDDDEFGVWIESFPPSAPEQPIATKYELEAHPPIARTQPVPFAPKELEDQPRIKMRERLSIGDYGGSLRCAELVLADLPDDPEATACVARCSSALVQVYTAKLGALDRVPIVAIPRHQLKWHALDHKTGFILSHIDGVSTLETILDISAMPTLDALRILYELVQQRIVSFR